MSGFVHGKGAVFWIDDSGGVLRNLSAYITSVSFKRSADVKESTTLGKNSRTFVAGLKNATISIQGYYDSTSGTGPSAVFRAALANQRSVEYGPEGGASGAEKLSCEVFGTGFEPGPANVDGIVPFSAELQVSGDITEGTFS